jgi:hypothetical protein
LKAALKEQNDQHEAQTSTAQTPPEQQEEKVVITEEELEVFYVVKSILRNTIPAERITYRGCTNVFLHFH